LYQHPWFVRVCSGAGESWFSEKADSQLPQVFRADDREHSTYLVESDVDEALAVAAHQLTNPSQKLDSQYALRIRFMDAEEMGITVSRQHLGETGIVKVDFAHRDLVGDKDRIERLTSLIREKALWGEDRIRRFNRFQLQVMIGRILDLGIEERPAHTAELCEILLKRRTQRTDDRERALSDLAGVRIPDFAIEPVAYQFFERRGSGGGAPSGDWYEALAHLRDQYRDHYMATHFVDR
jgi:hypothetical protein